MCILFGCSCCQQILESGVGEEKTGVEIRRAASTQSSKQVKRALQPDPISASLGVLDPGLRKGYTAALVRGDVWPRSVNGLPFLQLT